MFTEEEKKQAKEEIKKQMIKTKVRDKYRGLSKEEIIEKAYEIGGGFEEYSESCSQSVAAAIHEIVDIPDYIVKCSNSLAGGTADQTLGTCGALSGGILVLDYFFGRMPQDMSYDKLNKKNILLCDYAFRHPMKLTDKFIKEYGVIICTWIHRQQCGRTFWFQDPDSTKKFNDLGGHSDPNKCIRVVGLCSRWVMEILLDTGAVEL